jgi:hypothetical protein
MTKSKVIGLGVLLVILLSSLALAENDCLYYFYGEGCNDCNFATAKISELQTKYPGLEIKSFEVYFNRENLASLNSYFAAYNIPADQRGVPVVFSATSYFVGQKAITELLDAHIAENDNSACPTTAGSKVIGVVGKAEPLTLYKSLNLMVVGKAAVADYLSSGILTFIAVMLLFTVILVASGNSKRKVFKKNFWFIVAGFLVYLSYLLGLFTWFGQESIASLSFKIVAAVVIVLALLLLRRHLVGKGELFEDMAHAKQQAWKFRRNVLFSSVGVFLLGIVTALFTLAGTTKEFGWMRGLIEMREGTGVVTALGIFYLIVLFLLPLVVSFLLFLIREGGEDAGERGQWIWKKKELWWVNSIVAIVAVVLAVVALFL